MPFNFVGRVSQANQMKESLDISVQRTRQIADRVARATALKQGFALPDTPTAPGSTETGPIDIEAEMVSLADEQLRYEATTKLLAKTYEKLRAALKVG
jgi:flagellar basal body rod protein FlgB